MILSKLYDALKDAGQKVITLIGSHSWMQRSVDYIHDHPWISLGVTTGGVFIWKFITRPCDLPPGPFNVPFLGAVSFLRNEMHVKLQEVRPIYGDVIYLKVLGNQVVFLNSEKAIWEALIRRKEEFSSRRKSSFAGAVGLTGDENFAAPHDENWMANKKFIMTAFKNFGIGMAKSEAKIHQGLAKLNAALVEKNGQPFEVKNLLDAYSASLIFSIFFNQVRPLNDPQFSKISTIVSEFFTGFTEGIMMHDCFLYDHNLIRTLFCHQAVKHSRNATLAMIDLLEEMVNKHRGNFDSSYMRDIIDYYILHRKDLEDRSIAMNLVVILPDGIYTASLVLHWIIFYISKHQHVQKKLQQQIDKKIGKDRDPTLADKTVLPYGEAIIFETLRFSDVITILEARELKRDTEFMGYRIPKEAGVFASIHSMHFDPVVFPEPSCFDPSRFLDNDGDVDRAKATRVTTFSLGSRKCVGEQHVKAQLFLTLIHLAQKFNMTFDPNKEEPSDLPDPSIIFMKAPVPHQVCFTPR